MKIYYERKSFRNSNISEVIFCMPFELKDNFQDTDVNNNRFGEIIKNEENIIEFSNIETCDYVIIPYQWNKRDHQTLDLITYAKQHNKKIIGLHNSDFNSEHINIDEGYLFSTALNRSTKQSNEFSFPAFTGDFFKDNYLIDNESQKTIGFCGGITHNLRNKALSELNKNKDFKKNFIIRKGFWAPEISKTQAREEYMTHLNDNCFNLCVRGAGNFSYRLYETMMMGRIPIIVDSDQVFPFENILNYNDFSITLFENNINEINEKISLWLKNKTVEDIINIQKLNRNIWLEYMSPTGFLKNIKKEIEKI